MKWTLVFVAVFVLQACAGGSSSPGPAAPANPPPPSENPQPPTGQPESGNFFSAIDREIAASATGDRFLTERFYILMSRLSVYALICDAKNELGYSTQVSKLWNASTRLQKLAEKVYGGEKAAYNRFEKQRNIESRRLSFESGPNVCALSQASFVDYAGLSATELSNVIRNTPRGTL